MRLWDLRKLANFKTITLENSETTSVRFDYSGNYLGVGGSDIRSDSPFPLSLISPRALTFSFFFKN